MFNAALSFSGKAVSGFGMLLGGLIIRLVAFPASVAPAAVPAGAIQRLGVVGGVLVPLLYVIPITLITRYRLTPVKHAETRAALDARAMAGGDGG
jgi:Na+/melibiose symporter-like transporter